MVGLTFASVGSTDPPAAALQQLVAAHGGAWVSGGIGDGGGITHLVSTAAEARKPKGKKAAKYAAALENHVPIVSADYVRALAGEAVEVEPAEEAMEEAAEAKPKAAAKRKAAAAAPIDLDSDSSEDAPIAEAVEEDLSKLKVAELRDRLEQRGLDSSGKKAVLVERLGRPRRRRRAAAAARGVGGGRSISEEARAPRRSRPSRGRGGRQGEAGSGSQDDPMDLSGGGGTAARRRRQRRRRRRRRRVACTKGRWCGGGGTWPRCARRRPRAEAADDLGKPREAGGAAEAAASEGARDARQDHSGLSDCDGQPGLGDGRPRRRVRRRVQSGVARGDESNGHHERQQQVLQDAAELTGRHRSRDPASHSPRLPPHKYYKMQLLRGRQQTPQYYVFKAWGRLGSGEDSRVNGDLVHEHGGNLEAAKKGFV